MGAIRPIRIAIAFGVVALVAACGSSGKSGNAAGSATSASGGSPTTVGATTATSAAASGKPLPDPCSLVTKQEVAPLFGNAAVTATSGKGFAPGTASCSFSLTVGVQGKQVNVETLNDYANNPAYVFPSSPSTVPGLGDRAVIESPQTSERRVSVKLGGNAIQITVDFYTQPPDEAFVTQLAKDAVGRA